MCTQSRNMRQYGVVKTARGDRHALCKKRIDSSDEDEDGSSSMEDADDTNKVNKGLIVLCNSLF